VVLVIVFYNIYIIKEYTYIIFIFKFTTTLYYFVSDYLKLVEYLFNALDLNKTGKCDKGLSDTVIEQLKTSLATNKTDARK
jgi:hypothetical protein